jgi:hypothetical protein
MIVCEPPVWVLCSYHMYDACFTTPSTGSVAPTVLMVVGLACRLHGWVLTAPLLLVDGIKGLRRRFHFLFLAVGCASTAHSLCCKFASNLW